MKLLLLGIVLVLQPRKLTEPEVINITERGEYTVENPLYQAVTFCLQCDAEYEPACFGVAARSRQTVTVLSDKGVPQTRCWMKDWKRAGK